MISPLLSNIYLHEVLDKLFVESVQPACQGRTFMVRYADDFVMGFERLEDVHKVRRVIAKRFARFGLKINTEKTRLVHFGRPLRAGGCSGDKPETFDFLGFTHYWGRSQKGNPVVMKKTAAGRSRRTLQAIKEWGMEHRHLSMNEQQRMPGGTLLDKVCSGVPISSTEAVDITLQIIDGLPSFSVIHSIIPSTPWKPKNL